MRAQTRLMKALPKEWLAALRIFTGCNGMTLAVPSGTARVGTVSALEADGGQLLALDVHQPVTMSGWIPRQFSLLVLLGGRMTVTRRDGRSWWFGPDGQMMAVPDDELRLELSAGSRLLLIEPALPAPAGVQTGPLQEAGSRLRPHVERYLLSSRYSHAHHHALDQAAGLFAAIRASLRGDRVRLPRRLQTRRDPRICKAIAMLESQRDWTFNLAELASLAGASERNLFYLMKSETGMTPYRYYQRCRLVRVRCALASCHHDTASVSWHANDEGFSHLGRFASLYRALFGELPSETLTWNRYLRSQASGLSGDDCQVVESPAGPV